MTVFPPLVTVHEYFTSAPVGLVTSSAVNVCLLPASTYLSTENFGLPVRYGADAVSSSSFLHEESAAAAASTDRAAIDNFLKIILTCLLLVVTIYKDVNFLRKIPIFAEILLES